MRALALIAAVGVIALGPSARGDDARPIGRGVGGIVDRGGFVIGIENVFGFAMEGEGSTNTQLGLGPGFVASRLSFSGVTTSGLTIGGAFSLFDFREERGRHGGMLLVSPRLGYMLMSRRGFGLWPQLGMAARLPPSALFERDPVLTVTMDLPVLASLTEHSALTLGPALERPLGGPPHGYAAITAGLLGVF